MVWCKRIKRWRRNWLKQMQTLSKLKRWSNLLIHQFWLRKKPLIVWRSKQRLKLKQRCNKLKLKHKRLLWKPTLRQIHWRPMICWLSHKLRTKSWLLKRMLWTRTWVPLRPRLKVYCRHKWIWLRLMIGLRSKSQPLTKCHQHHLHRLHQHQQPLIVQK